MRIAVIVVHIIVSVALVAFVLLQSGHAAGLSGAISGGAERFFGKKKGMDDLLARYTEFAAIGFFLTALILTITGY